MMNPRLIQQTIFAILIISSTAFGVSPSPNDNCAPAMAELGKGTSPRTSMDNRFLDEAVQNPQLQVLASTTKEALTFISSLNAEDFIKLSNILEEIQARGFLKNWGGIFKKERPFPSDFYELYLGDLSQDRTDIEKQYQLLSSHFSGRDISNETLTVIAFLTYKLNIRKKAPIDTKRLQEFSMEFILQQDRLSRLPIFRDFINSSDEMFIRYAVYVRAHMGAQKEIVLSDSTRYETSLRNILNESEKESGPLTLNDKVQIAIGLLESPLRMAPSYNYDFDWLLAPSSGNKKIIKWKAVGPGFLAYEIHHYVAKMMHIMMDPSVNEELAQNEINKFGSQYSPDPESKEARFMLAALKYFYIRGAEGNNVTIREIAQQMQTQFDIITDSFKAVMKEEKKRVLEAQRKAQAEAAANNVTSVISNRQKGVREISLRIKEEKPQTIPAAKAKPAMLPPLAESIPLLNLQKEPTLVVPQRLFSFEKFNVSVETTQNYQYVKFSEEFLSETRKHNLKIEPLIRHFLTGPVASSNASGLKKLRSGTNLWEIKTTGSNYRVIVQQDKSSRTWTWLGLVPHNKVDEYRIQHNL